MSQVTGDGRSTRWADHRAARRAELVRIARKAVHHHGPDVSMDEIAAAAGTSKSIVYRYFADKTGLQIAVGELVVADMHDALLSAAQSAATAREGLRRMVGIYLEMVEHSPHVYYFVTRPGADDATAKVGHFLEAVTALVAAPFATVFADLLPGAVVGGLQATVADDDGAAGPPDPAVAAWAAGAVGFVRGVGEWWLARGTDIDRDALATQVTDWLWAGPARQATEEAP